jgi:hypothetical protein
MADSLVGYSRVVSGQLDEMVAACSPAADGAPLGRDESALVSKVGKGSYKIELPKGGKTGPRNGLAHLEGLSTGEHRVLTAAAQHTFQGGVTREQLTVLCGYKRSSRDTFIQRLRAANLLKIAGDRLLPTDLGLAMLGDSFVELPTGQALLDYWRQNLSEGERRVLDGAVKAYPDWVPRQEIDDATEYKRSSRDTFIQRLRSRQLVETRTSEIRASDMLFD